MGQGQVVAAIFFHGFLEEFIARLAGGPLLAYLHRKLLDKTCVGANLKGQLILVCNFMDKGKLLGKLILAPEHVVIVCKDYLYVQLLLELVEQEHKAH